MVFAKLSVLFLVSVVFVQISTQNKILKKGPHYTIKEYTGEPIAVKYGRDLSYKLTETIPMNSTVPADWGGNFGDMDFMVYEDGDFIARDSIVNPSYNTTVGIFYKRQIDGYNATAINVLNFGRQRGYTVMGGLGHLGGTWEAQIMVAAGKEVRMLVECYGKPRN